MGKTLTKFEVMDLVDDILVNTVHADRLLELRKKEAVDGTSTS
jgi:hypothetical protein